MRGWHVRRNQRVGHRPRASQRNPGADDQTGAGGMDVNAMTIHLEKPDVGIQVDGHDDE
jgi:hypothetical protein